MTNLRDIPSVDRLLTALAAAVPHLPHALLRTLAREEVDRLREQMRQDDRPAVALLDHLIQRVVARLDSDLRPTLRPVINASGVIIQTNLGRAPLSRAALEAMQRVGAGYSNLEYDLDAGSRGSRTVHLEALLCRITGAEAALAVNNNAAAIYLVLSALAVGREVIISRGQAVEIGGGFRIPDVLRQSGAQLVEVGTTNRTYMRDYAAAISERTALLLRVHTSNFRVVGFTHETSLAELATLSHERGLPLVDDLGSGTLLPTDAYGLFPEPTVQESVAAGADLITFSGDKLLGGPQAGLIVGRRSLVEQLKQHPLARALRVDKTTIAGMEATLLSYLHGRAIQEIPVWRMIATPLDELHRRAEALVAQLGSTVSRVACVSTVGGGSLPGATLPSVGLVLHGGDAALSRRLRLGEPALVARFYDGQLVCDLRTVLPEQDADLVQVIQAAL
ncbi:selenocysteine synthase [Oscillochloris trichoides DG-6]|uniref:L-seryl-tRNA(Sec) selenium transferase n=1 Tax=Oscillochloris trichoides DG-6 TaxID=765420 RepID=E1IIH2_9CHLR|nr:L-seryl-tRNA(Sec) selenium transferase [Oscillochloris trichoides]EFO79047.1 selenocysteine synthase [Oscillochloris trichoides DG-6]